MIKRIFSLILISSLLVVLPTGSFAQEHHDIYEEEWEDWETDDTFVISDPHVDLNRKVFRFNHKLYTKALFPLSRGYDKIVPKKIQVRYDKLITNAKMPTRFINNLLQFKIKGAAIELTRFVINCSIGIAGFYDPAESFFNLETQDEDFGQTLGHWGFGSGSYFVIPLVGPGSTRDIIGFFGNMATSPFFWAGQLEAVRPDEVMFGIQTSNKVNSFSLNVRDNYLRIYDSAIDPYSAIQHAYVKNREKKIQE